MGTVTVPQCFGMNFAEVYIFSELKLHILQYKLMYSTEAFSSAHIVHIIRSIYVLVVVFMYLWGLTWIFSEK